MISMSLNFKKISSAFKGEAGQSTLEYALVLLILLALVMALAALYRFSSEGRLSELIFQSLSHVVQVKEGLGGIQDILLY